MLIIRTWKRDRTTNSLHLDVAAENLRRNGLQKSTGDVVARRLMDGEVLETKCAYFSRPGVAVPEEEQ